MTDPEPTSEIEGFIRKHGLLFIFLIIAAVAVYGIITMQLLAAALVIMVIIGVTFILWGARKHRERTGDPARDPDSMDEGWAVIAAAIIAFVGLGTNIWLVWVIALAVLFLIQQSLARIERQLDRLARKE
ncbi:MAG: hypothetical protein M0Q92_14160 [Methanoregula sp.]|jgi:Flp pilus assembly protein TadB|nr:hypothetical protein [Methanoregula sp.]